MPQSLLTRVGLILYYVTVCDGVVEGQRRCCSERGAGQDKQYTEGGAGQQADTPGCPSANDSSAAAAPATANRQRRGSAAGRAGGASRLEPSAVGPPKRGTDEDQHDVLPVDEPGSAGRQRRYVLHGAGPASGSAGATLGAAAQACARARRSLRHAIADPNDHPREPQVGV